MTIPATRWCHIFNTQKHANTHTHKTRDCGCTSFITLFFWRLFYTCRQMNDIELEAIPSYSSLDIEWVTMCLIVKYHQPQFSKHIVSCAIDRAFMVASEEIWWKYGKIKRNVVKWNGAWEKVKRMGRDEQNWRKTLKRERGGGGSHME